MKTARILNNPGKVLTKALQLGLTSTAYLTRCRVTKATRHLYWGGKGRKGIRRMMSDALSDYQRSVREKRPNARHLQRYENNIRRNHNKVVLNTSVAYGNVEEKRRRRDEDRKYVNTLADYFGAKIRNIGASRFQFPVPAKTYTSNGAVKRFYPGNSRIPEYAPRHVAPELDFMDMIRSHGIELARQCMKYSVLMRDAKRYLSRLIDRLIPYLVYVYTEGREGEKGFIHGGVNELRQIVREIQILYPGVNGRPQSITAEASELIHQSKEPDVPLNDSDFVEIQRPEGVVDDDESESLDSEEIAEEDVDRFFDHILGNCDVATNPHWRPHVEKAWALVKQGLLTRNDAEYILTLILEDSRKRGSAFHDFVANSEFTVRPFSLLGPIKYGDGMANENTDLLFACEVSIADGRGRTDILVFRRKSLEQVDDSPPTIVWEPCILIEIKTKCFYGLDLYATATKSKEVGKRVVEPILEKRRADASEWEDVVSSTPDKYAREQLEAYERAVLSEYRKYVRNDSNPPQYLMKGVLVVDLAENWEILRDNIRGLILQAYHSAQETAPSKRQHFYPVLRGKKIRMGLVVFNDYEHRTTTPVGKPSEFNPFSHSRNRDDDRKFTLYLSVSGKGSPSVAAAEIAARWHGLKLIHERTKGKLRDVLWLDLAGEHKNSRLRDQSLHLILQPKGVQYLVRKKIALIDLSEEMSSYFHDSVSIEVLGRKIRESLHRKRRPFIIVTGFDRIREGMLRERMHLLDGFIIWFKDQIPHQSSVLWFDKPVPTAWTSQEYDTRGVAPFYSSSPWRYVVDEIVYNIPTSPRRYGSYVPAEDDVRWIVIENDSNLTYDTELIPPLYLWGEQFRPDSNREDNIDRQQMFYLKSTYSSTRHRNLRKYDDDDFISVLGLIPHLNRFYENNDLGDIEILGDNEVKILSKDLFETPSDSSSVLGRLVFTPSQALTSVERDGRVTRLMPLSMINAARKYRKTRLLTEYKRETTRPPHTGLLRYRGVNMFTVVKRELSGLRRILKIIENRHGEKEEWKEFLDSLKKLLDSRQINNYKQEDVLNVLRSVHVFLETHELSRSIWNALKPARTWILDGLLDEDQTNLRKLLAKDPDLLLLAGNHLFLLLLASLYEAKTLDLSTGFIERLWRYLLPFQMTGIGFEPEYPSEHNTGKSFLHRTKLLTRLASWARGLKESQASQNLDEILFGRACFVKGNEGETVSYLLLAFQTTLGSQEVSLAFLKAAAGTDGSVNEVLRNLCQDRPFWGASDLQTLRDLAEKVDIDEAVDVMVASQNGIRGLWFCDNGSDKWIPVGRMDYYSRKRETVTLLMSVIIREDSTLQEVSSECIRTPPESLRDSIGIGLQLVSAAFRTCIHVKCNVSLDHDEKMFRISFVKLKAKKKVGNLLIKRTIDLLEILRRPDVLCEPVIIEGKHCIWNRFHDIEYDEDVKILRPYVIRSNPFKIDSLALPQNAEILCSMRKGNTLRMRIVHDPYVCPLRSMRFESITQQPDRSASIADYLRNIDGNPGQPELLFNESIYRHGTCWRMEFDSESGLPEKIQELETVRFGGPAIATLLETGTLFYSAPNGEWITRELHVPESRDLPKEFKESIHLMSWRKDTAIYPGSYLLDSWIPEIHIYKDRINFKLVSKLALQEKIHTIFESNAEMLGKEKLRELLKNGMKKILELGGFSRNKTMMHLGEEEVAGQLTYIDESGRELQYDSVEIAKDRFQEQVIVANFVTHDGEYVSIQVTQQILTYRDWTELSGGIDLDIIEVEISDRLHGYNVNDKDIQAIMEEVKELLEEWGVVFFET